MCDSHQPENGADSEPIEEPEGNHVDPPMVELPHADASLVEAYVKSALPPDASAALIKSEVSKVVMADALGRAIHVMRGPGQLIDMGKCVRINHAEEVQPVPYGYDDADRGYRCDCEDIALGLVALMQGMTIAQDVEHKPSIEVATDLPRKDRLN